MKRVETDYGTRDYNYRAEIPAGTDGFRLYIYVETDNGGEYELRWRLFRPDECDWFGKTGPAWNVTRDEPSTDVNLALTSMRHEVVDVFKGWAINNPGSLPEDFRIGPFPEFPGDDWTQVPRWEGWGE